MLAWRPDARPTLSIWPPPNLLAAAVSVVPSSAPVKAAFTCLSTSSPTSPSTSFPPYNLDRRSYLQGSKNLTLIEVDIKWVNDIYYRNKKISGILTEATTSIEQARH